MNFSNFTKISSGNLIYFRNEAPIENVGSIKFYKDNASGTFLKKELRWSFDRTHWSSWEDLNVGNIANVKIGDNKYLFFEIKYTNSSAGKVSSFSIEYLPNTGKTYAPPIEDVNFDHDHIITDGCNDLGGVTKSVEVVKITDAETLCGKSCDYYLWRPNQKGEQAISTITDLQKILDNLSQSGPFIRDTSLGFGLFWNNGLMDVSVEGGSVGGPFVKEASLGTGLYWNPSTGLLDVSVSGGGSFTGDVSTTHVWYETALDPSLAMPSAVGGIPAGTTVFNLRGDTVTTILNDLLFPTVAPTLNAPSYSFTDNVAALQEIAASISGTFSSSFNRGSIYNGATFQNFRSGLPNQYTFTDASSNTLLVDLSTNSLTNNQTVNGYFVKIGNQSFSGKVYYDIGPQPLDNKGNPSGSPLAAGSIGPNSTSFEGVYPLFGTTVTIGTLTKQSLVSMLSANSIVFNMVAESGGNKQKIEIPTAWTGAPTSRPLVGVQQYNTVSAQWEYPGGSAVTSLLLWNTSATNETVQSILIPYTQYTYNGTDRSAVQIRLVF